jgi:hypothetical protein
MSLSLLLSHWDVESSARAGDFEQLIAGGPSGLENGYAEGLINSAKNANFYRAVFSGFGFRGFTGQCTRKAVDVAARGN